ncbi:hypothetical protein [Moorella sp. E306M]|jgi:hypothetical protein|uniref:hypothetical protein n=1 Tax=Moorella sp. E306M TaxID=2572683 RepID=UPI0010FFBC53|nr:hypothetical protein [Moorella sp. E306M]GEA17307.1 hypothetical protein E306M_04410 [Moorella sp. E306M]
MEEQFIKPTERGQVTIPTGRSWRNWPDEIKLATFGGKDLYPGILTKVAALPYEMTYA